MEYTYTAYDANTAGQFRSLIWDRLSTSNHFGVKVGHTDQGIFSEFTVGNLLFVHVKVYRDVDGTIGDCYLSLFDGYDTPSAHVIINDEIVNLAGRGAEDYAAVVARMKTRLQSGIITPKLHMPYGHVQEGLVTAIWYTSVFEKVATPGTFHAAVREFVLQGFDLPASFFLRNESAEAYAQAHWDLLATGHIIELRDRIVHRPGALWFYSSGSVEWPQLIFDEDDGKEPILPADVPYLFRPASESPKGNLSRMWECVDWYADAGHPPQNLSESFANY